MSRNVEDLTSILAAEADLMEALAKVIVEKQQAIVKFQGDSLEENTLKEQHLLQSLQTLERERVLCSGALVKSLALRNGDEPRGPVALTELARSLEGDDGERVTALAGRIRTTVQNILSTNGQNQVLLQHSLRFVQQTLRIITDDNRKPLIDERM